MTRCSEKLEEANKLIFVKEYEKAERVVAEILENDPRLVDILIHLRRIELGVRLETLDTICDEYEQIARDEPTSKTAQICLILAKQHGELISPEKAIEEFQALLKSLGPHPALYYGIGFAMEMSGNFERALTNYEQCVNSDPAWYPGYFGMSQIFYHLGEEEKGDHFFYLFEELAPYNVYGNFETHQRLAADFIQLEQYDYAEKSIEALSEWWMENKGYCPIEIQVYERFATAKIADLQSDTALYQQRRNQGRILVERALSDEEENEGVLYFIAKVLEEHAETRLAFNVYKTILSREVSNPEIVQKIGSHFLSLGEHELAAELFYEAYKHHPDHPEIRFCWIVSRLRLKKVNVEEYLIEKERLKNLIEEDGDKVEVLALLHSLMERFDEDSEVHSHMGDMYLKMGNNDRAKAHFANMLDIDGYSAVTKIKYASIEMQHGDCETAVNLLKSIELDSLSDSHKAGEIQWLYSNYYFLKKDYEKCLEYLGKTLLLDPWNVTYLVQQILALSAIAESKVNWNLYDSTLKKLAASIEDDLDWQRYRALTEKIEEAHLQELAYARAKIGFLYADGSEAELVYLVRTACKFDANKSTYDFLKLLNTNFDSPNIYWALGSLYKELWQLEVATVWYEQILIASAATEKHQAKAYLELADCFCWQGNNLDKAVEYARLSLDLDHSLQKNGIRILAHALLKRGDARQAEVYLEELEENNESVYLRGLLHYRNGAHDKANELWKPLLTVVTTTLRLHHIKQQVLKYYFDKVPYDAIN